MFGINVRHHFESFNMKTRCAGVPFNRFVLETQWAFGFILSSMLTLLQILRNKAHNATQKHD